MILTFSLGTGKLPYGTQLDPEQMFHDLAGHISSMITQMHDAQAKPLRENLFYSMKLTRVQYRLC